MVTYGEVASKLIVHNYFSCSLSPEHTWKQKADIPRRGRPVCVKVGDKYFLDTGLRQNLRDNLQRIWP